MSATGLDGGIIPISPWKGSWPSWKHPALFDESSRLVFDPSVSPRAHRMERRPFKDATTHRRGGLATAGVDWAFYVYSERDPVLVIRRVDHGWVRIEDFEGRPYSGSMTLEDATTALREALEEVIG